MVVLFVDNAGGSCVYDGRSALKTGRVQPDDAQIKGVPGITSAEGGKFNKFIKRLEYHIKRNARTIGK